MKQRARHQLEGGGRRKGRSEYRKDGEKERELGKEGRKWEGEEEREEGREKRE